MDLARTPGRAAGQRGVFSRAQAYDEGWSPRQVRRRLAAGRWLVVAGDAICAARTAIGPWELAHAVVLTWPGAVVSHHLAGELHGFPSPSTGTTTPSGAGTSIGSRGPATATVPHGHGLYARGLQAHQLRLDPRDFVLMDGLPVTTEPRTAADLLAVLDWDQARSLLAWLVTRRRFTLDDLTTAIGRRHCWTGTAQLRRLAEVSAGGSLSAAEDRLHEVLSGAGITGWVANEPVLVAGVLIAVVDVLFALGRVVVEVDGFATHSSPEAFQRDRVRQNQLVAAGYTVLRFTWSDIVDRPGYVIATIKSALERTGA